MTGITIVTTTPNSTSSYDRTTEVITSRRNQETTAKLPTSLPGTERYNSKIGFIMLFFTFGLFSAGDHKLRVAVMHVTHVNMQ